MEHYQFIAKRIEDLRGITRFCRGLEAPKDKNILEAFTSLAVFVFEVFELPISHHNYIASELGLKECIAQKMMLNELIKKYDTTIGDFDIERPLRGVEVFFSYGKPEFTIEQLDELNYRIACLHVLIGDRVYARNYLNTISK
ncbi:MAG: hypothetical protein ACERIH_09270 [Labilibaculum antarcticum]